jgi:hypothetical protein
MERREQSLALSLYRSSFLLVALATILQALRWCRPDRAFIQIQRMGSCRVAAKCALLCEHATAWRHEHFKLSKWGACRRLARSRRQLRTEMPGAFCDRNVREFSNGHNRLTTPTNWKQWLVSSLRGIRVRRTLQVTPNQPAVIQEVKAGINLQVSR